VTEARAIQVAVTKGQRLTDTYTDKHGRTRKRARRALSATSINKTIEELTALQWRDVDLAGSRLTVRASKTDAGMRQVDLLPALRDELAAYKAQAASTGPSVFVFTTATGSELIQGNIRQRVLDKAVAKANERLTEADDVPLPEGLTPHKLRHTFASILVALGVDPGSVMDQIGHTDPGFTLRVYRHGMRGDGAAKSACGNSSGGVLRGRLWLAARRTHPGACLRKVGGKLSVLRVECSHR
jgi:integrase